MDIGNQIKNRRLELDMTQDMLAKKLNVGRSTVSNWEIGRNYPDIQLIVIISNVLNLSLDILLREESEIVKEITRDTHVRKSQSRKIKILSAVIVLLLTAGMFVIYKVCEYQDLSKPDQIVSVQPHENRLDILTDLPFYRSVVGYTVGNSSKGNEVIEISLSSKIDLTLKNKQKITVKIESLSKDIGVKKIEKVNFVNPDGIIKSFNL